LLSFFERLTSASLMAHNGARRALHRKIKRSRAEESELRGSYPALEKRIAEYAAELAEARAGLELESERCRSAEARFLAVSEALAYGAWIYRRDGTAELVSASYRELLGESAERVAGRPWFSLVHPQDRERVTALWKKTTARGMAWNCEFRVTSREGQIRHILSRGSPLAEPGQRAQLYAGVQLDVSDRVWMREELLRARSKLEMQVARKTEQLREANRQLVLDLADRMKAELALRDRESQLRAIYENALDSMIVLDDARRVIDANESAQQLFAMSLEEMRGARWDDLLPREGREGLDERWAEFLQAGGSRRGEVDVRRADGCARAVAFRSRANIARGRHLMTLRDITDHRQAEDSLRLLSHRLMRLQDEERRRIARELHDSTGQGLAAIRMHLETIQRAVPEPPDGARKALEEALSTCQTCSADLRTVSYLLHPPLLDELGLMPALDWYVSGFSERSGIQVTQEISEPRAPLSKDLNTALFRIIQEALVNIHKHAESQEARVRMYCRNNTLVLEISDNGKGFDPSLLEGRREGVRGLGVGITGMRERVRQLHGTLETAAANPGTLVRATFPIREEYHGNA
jgi:PAS domain S-box-containing protein